MNRSSVVSFLRAVTLVGVYGGLLVPPMFIPMVIFPFVFSKLIFFQILIGLTFPAYAALAWMEPKYRPRFHWLYAAIAAYLIAIGISVVFAVDPMRAWWGNQERMNGLFTVLHFFVWLSMAVGVVHRWDGWRRLLNFEVGISAFMGLVALLQKIQPNLLGFPAGPRVGGLLDNPIYMAAYQIFNLFFLALLFLKTPSKQARIAYAIIAFVDVSAFVAAQSRGALVGLGAGVLVFALFYGMCTKNKKTRLGILCGMAILVATYGLLFALRDTSLIRDSSFARLTSFGGSASTRLIAWDIAWQGFLERPLTGWGFDNFHHLFNSHYNPSSFRYGVYETWFDRSHNTVLDVLSMTGLLGFTTYAAVFAALFISVWRAYRKGWIDLPIAAIFVALPIAYFVQNIFVFDHPAAFSMSFLLYALIIAATRGEFLATAPPAEIAGKTRGVTWIGFGLLQIAALVLVWRTSALPFQASRYALYGNSFFGTPAAFEAIKRASEIWTPYLDEQSFLLGRNLIVHASRNQIDRVNHWQELYALAKTLSQEELRRHPLNTNPNFLYAQLLATFSTRVPADAALVIPQFEKTLATSPKRQQVFYNLGNYYSTIGQPERTTELYKQALELDPEVGEALWVYGSLLLSRDTRSMEGIQMLVRSQEVGRPYQPMDVREMSQVFEALRIGGKRDKLAGLLRRLSDMARAGSEEYARLAFQYERVGMEKERDEVLAYALQFDPQVRTIFEQIKAGFLNEQGQRVLTAPKK